MTFTDDEISRRNVIRFRVTGSAAHSRLSPLVPSDSIDCSPYNAGAGAVTVTTTNDGEDDVVTTDPSSSSSSLTPPIDFLWENAPRHETRQYRNYVKCYSHLPNGTDILDSKWVLARLFAHAENNNHHPHYHREGVDSNDHGHRPRRTTTSSCGVLETHCFRGLSGLVNLVERLDLNKNRGTATIDCSDLHDLMKAPPTPPPQLSPNNTSRSSPPNLWVIKDASSNGAGGIWVLGQQNVTHLTQSDTSPLIEDHRYVAQRYVWPPVLYHGRKCHVRVYGLFTSDGRAFVHSKAFLHVANDLFTIHTTNDESLFMDSVHITNCCANSHNEELFAGEICASLIPISSENDPPTNECTAQPSAYSKVQIVPLEEYADSIYETVAELARRTFPFLQGGQANNGFEYLGMDFILSHDEDTNKPIAYLLEVNAPPSQDTATGLSHAEELHNSVISDLLTLWVLPKVLGVEERCGGWHCVYHDTTLKFSANSNSVLPSKAGILNKMRWATFERKMSRMLETYQEHVVVDCQPTSAWSIAIREYFPYFNVDPSSTMCQQQRSLIFFENAGGSQVPLSVITSVQRALSKRHRSVLGYEARNGAEAILRTILGASVDSYALYFGSNATTLLALLAHRYGQSEFLSHGDEVLISIENHTANVTPWIELAQLVGATVVWCPNSSALAVQPHLTTRTRIVALSHASNLLGHVRDITTTCDAVRQITKRKAHVIVDGVAVTPHRYAALDDLPVDWYVVSCHKMFGTHLGVLCGRQKIVSKIEDRQRGTDLRPHLEMGTVNYEACAGIEGLGKYLSNVATTGSSISGGKIVDAGPLTRRAAEAAYKIIERLEEPLVILLRQSLSQSSKVKIVEDVRYDSVGRLPVFSFVHCDIPCREIVDTCMKQGIVCRSGTFLSTSLLQEEFGLRPNDGVVRTSLAHYNTTQEVLRLTRVLEDIPGWF